MSIDYCKATAFEQIQLAAKAAEELDGLTAEALRIQKARQLKRDEAKGRLEAAKSLRYGGRDWIAEALGAEVRDAIVDSLVTLSQQNY